MTQYQAFDEALLELQHAGMERKLHPMTHDGAYIVAEGRRMLNLSGNDYLGIASRGDMRHLEAELAARYGLAGSTSSRLLTGNYDIYTQLESAMAQRFSREAALLFNSGYHMNLGILSALADRNTVVLADKLVHASMIDGIRLSGCVWERFRHNDLNHLERLLTKHQDAPRIIVMVESIYSMDGDRADLSALVSLKARYPQVMLYVDEAHAIGILGPTGLGLAEESGTIADIDLLVGTMGKAMASMGAYIICDEVIRRLLINRCRSLIFSTALPPVCIAFAQEVFDRLAGYDAERAQVAAYATTLRNALAEVGHSTPSESHIIPIQIGQASHTVRIAEQLRALGYYALPIRPPTVPLGSSRLRLSLSTETPTAPLVPLLLELMRAEGLLTNI